MCVYVYKHKLFCAPYNMVAAAGSYQHALGLYAEI
jgi:hypothetical protein